MCCRLCCKPAIGSRESERLQTAVCGCHSIQQTMCYLGSSTMHLLLMRKLMYSYLHVFKIMIAEKTQKTVIALLITDGGDLYVQLT